MMNRFLAHHLLPQSEFLFRLCSATQILTVHVSSNHLLVRSLTSLYRSEIYKFQPCFGKWPQVEASASELTCFYLIHPCKVIEEPNLVNTKRLKQRYFQLIFLCLVTEIFSKICLKFKLLRHKSNATVSQFNIIAVR